MIKVIGKAYVKEGLTTEEFKNRWLTDVMPLIKQLPGLRKYVINIVVATSGEEPGYQGTVELHWDNVESWQNDLSSPLGKQAEKHVAKMIRKLTYVVTEEYNII